MSVGHYTLSIRTSIIPTKTGVSGSSSIVELSLTHGIGTNDMAYAHQRSTQAICDVGHYCVGGVRHSCPAGVYGDTEGLTTAECSGVCPSGYFCPEATYSKFQFRCPAGRYGGVTGLTDSSCSGLCEAGYYCPEQSTSPTQVACGHLYTRSEPSDDVISTIEVGRALSHPNSVFCWQGSPVPQSVHPGFYSVNNDYLTRSAEVQCPKGSY
mgnify:CR=1 FL=1